MKIVQQNGNIELHEAKNFVLIETLDCGQAFRWQEISPNIWQGVAFGRLLKIGSADGIITLYDTTEEDFNLIWREYFDLDRNYGEILSALSQNEVLKTAGEFAGGIRILKQEPWEALCSFIISQNNNIPRIKKIVNSLCQKYGEKIEFNGENYYSFPSAQVLENAGVDAIFELKTGFRAKYIHDAASKVSSGEILLDKIKESDFENALNELCKIKGVGLKVASCALLFGFDKTDAFPVDVWVKRVLAKYYPDGLDLNNLGEFAGMIQQYLFYYERYNR